ncbi:restriction endonuclease subunit S [Aeromonas veronii]|uniref:restriction endonuclease subunit S n=1 Tax=Aeromonas veronii TaxID=654 RepID=UPI003D1D7CEF
MVNNNPLLSGSNSWSVSCLKDISLKIGSGSTPRGGESAYIPERINFAFIRSQNVYDFKFDVNGLRFISDEDAKKLNGVHLQKDDVLLNITGDGVTFSRCCIVPENILPAAVNQHVAIIRLDTTKCLPSYLMAYLCLPETKAYIESFNAGGSRRAITKGHIENFEIPLPPMYIQECISKILLGFLAKLDINAQLNQTLDQIVQTLFKSWFMDFDPVIDNALDAGFFEQHLAFSKELLRRVKARKAVRVKEGFKPLPKLISKLFPNSFEECGEPSLGLGGWVPQGWHILQLSDLAKVASGKRPPSKITQRTKDEPIPVWGGNGIKWFTNIALYHDKYIITGRVGTLGTVYKVKGPSWASDNALVIRPLKNYFYEFIFQTLSHFDINTLNSGSTQPLVTQTALNGIKCVFPINNGLLSKFQELADKYDSKIELITLETDTLVQLRDALLPKMMAKSINIDGDL